MTVSARLTAALTIFLAASSPYATTPMPRELEGIEGLWVRVMVSNGLPLDSVKLERELKAGIEERLRAAGLKSYSERTPAMILVVSGRALGLVSCVKEEYYMVYLTLQVSEKVVIEREQRLVIPATTWDAGVRMMIAKRGELTEEITITAEGIVEELFALIGTVERMRRLEQ